MFPHFPIEGNCPVILILASAGMSWVWCLGALVIEEVFLRHGVQIPSQTFQAPSKGVVDHRVNVLVIVMKG